MVLCTEAVKLVHRDDVGESLEGLIPDGLAADEFLFRPAQFGFGQTFGGQSRDFLVEIFPHQIDLGRIGAEVESEDARGKAHHLRGADKIGQPQLFADAVEKTRGHVTARRINQLQRRAVRAQGIRTAESGHEDGLLFGFVDHDFRGGTERWCDRWIGHEQRALAQSAEHFCGHGAHFLDRNIAEDGEHAVLGGDAFLPEGEQLLAGQRFHRVRRPARTQTVGVIAENGPPHGIPRHGGDLFVLRFDRSNLVFLFARDFFFRKRGVRQHVGQNVHAQTEVGLHYLDGNAEAVVAGVGADLSADGLDFVVELLGAAAFRAFDQSACGQRGDPVGRRILGQQSSAKYSDEIDQRQFVVRADQHAQSVGQGEFFDLSRSGDVRRPGGEIERTFRIERGDGGLRFGEVATGHALQVGGFDASDVPEVFRSEVGIAGEEPTAADVGSAAAGGRQIVQLIGEDAFAGLGHLGGRGGLPAVAIDDFQHSLRGFGAFVRVAEEVDAEESHLSGHVGISRDVVDEVPLLAQLKMQRRAASAAQDSGEHVERRGVGVGDGRDVPDEGTTRQFGLEFLVRLTASELRGFVRDEKRRLGLTGCGPEIFLRVGENLRGVHIAGDDEEHVLRRVARAVVSGEVVAGQAVENFEMTDDRVPIGTGAESRRKHQLRAHAVRIVEAHGELAADDFLFLGKFLGGKGRMQSRVGEQFHGGGRTVCRHVDPINRAVERGVGIDIAARLLHGAGDFVGAALFRALENHVLEQMRQSGAEP